jgi:hypothetical protein
MGPVPQSFEQTNAIFLRDQSEQTATLVYAQLNFLLRERILKCLLRSQQILNALPVSKPTNHEMLHGTSHMENSFVGNPVKQITQFNTENETVVLKITLRQMLRR